MGAVETLKRLTPKPTSLMGIGSIDHPLQVLHDGKTVAKAIRSFGTK